MAWALTESEAGALVAAALRVCEPYRENRTAFMEIDGLTLPITLRDVVREDAPQDIRSLATVVDIILDRGAVAGGS